MNIKHVPCLRCVVVAVLLFVFAGCAGNGALDRAMGESMIKQTVTGPFDITLAPQQPDGPGVGDPIIARMSIDKRFHGDLEAVSKGQMLGVRTAVDGSAGYVAIERVVGTLAGRAGSFVLQHSSTMDRGTPMQSVSVVPDSGTDQLEGLAGVMTIDITGGAHVYHFEYWFEPARQE